MHSFCKTKVKCQYQWLLSQNCHVFYQGLLLTDSPTSSPFCFPTRQPCSPRAAGTVMLWAPAHSRKLGASRGCPSCRGHPWSRAGQHHCSSHEATAEMLPLLYLPSRGADDQEPHFARQLQIRQSHFWQVLYKPLGKTALNLHRVTSCTGGLYNFTGSCS